MDRKQTHTVCWQCGVLAKIGECCLNCKAPISKPIADIEMSECECGKRVPVGMRCPYCGKESNHEISDSPVFTTGV